MITKYDELFEKILIIGILFYIFENMIKWIKILKSLKYDKTQYDKHFGIFYHMALSKYDKKKPTDGCH